MKNKNILKQAFFIIIGLIIMVSSCNKDYYLDGGIYDAKYNGTILQFLKSKPELFDTLVKVLDHTNYSTMVNNLDKNITFFVPTSQSIMKSVKTLNSLLFNRGQDTVLDVRQISPDVWAKYLSRYIFQDKYLLKDFPQIDTTNLLPYPGQNYLSISGQLLNIGVLYNDVRTRNNDGIIQTVKYGGYRQLIIDRNYPVATSDIQPVNGVVHVLRYVGHDFGFSSIDFSIDAINKGITY